MYRTREEAQAAIDAASGMVPDWYEPPDEIEYNFPADFLIEPIESTCTFLRRLGYDAWPAYKRSKVFTGWEPGGIDEGWGIYGTFRPGPLRVGIVLGTTEIKASPDWFGGTVYENATRIVAEWDAIA